MMRTAIALTVCCLASLRTLAAPPPAGPTPILLIQSTENGKPPGSTWRYFETWQTDVCRTVDGQLVRVDPFDPRLYENEQGQWVSVKKDHFDGFAPGKKYRVNPTSVIRGSPPLADD